jgi:fimbrial chaperone protein
MKHIQPAAARRLSLSIALGAGIFCLAGTAAQAQALTVLPVNLTLPPGQLAGTLTVINKGDAETSVQMRALAWSQPGGVETLTASDEVLISPPIATIAAGATQVVRLVLRHPEQTKEGTFRILLDQIPPAASPGTVRIALRLSIPVFAEPASRASPHVAFRIENDAGHAYLVGANTGSRHDTVHDIGLTISDGTNVPTATSASPYILADSTQRWELTGTGPLPQAGAVLHLTASAETGALSESVSVLTQP